LLSCIKEEGYNNLRHSSCSCRWKQLFWGEKAFWQNRNTIIRLITTKMVPLWNRHLPLPCYAFQYFSFLNFASYIWSWWTHCIKLRYLGITALNIFYCCTCVTIDLLHFCDVCTVQNWRGQPTGLWKWITYLLQCDIVAGVMCHATVSWFILHILCRNLKLIQIYDSLH